jgi:hypothetical protein
MEAKYIIRYFFDYRAETCLWSANDAARNEFGYPIKLSLLPLNERTKDRIQELCRKFDTSLNWGDPSSPSPWGKKDFALFQEAASELLKTIEGELGIDYQLINEIRLNES